MLSWVGTPVLYGVSETKPVALAGHGGAVPRLALEMSVWAAGLFRGQPDGLVGLWASGRAGCPQARRVY